MVFLSICDGLGPVGPNNAQLRSRYSSTAELG